MSSDFDTNDYNLTANHIGQLENAEEVVRFFAMLRYDVDRSAGLDHAALGLDSEDLRQQIRQIRLVGVDPVDGEIVIYLLEVRSVTVQLRQQIARRFRERSESALLVLTTDYESLDFVLLDEDREKSKSLGRAFRRIIRPRPLTVNRRKPRPVALRVLKRFTFTEADGDYQWDKLRSAYTLAEWSEPYFNNRALFSDYYLKERLTDARLTPAWAEDVRPIGRQVFNHLADARQRYTGKPESVIRRGLFEPLFTALGFQWARHKAGDSTVEEPDYLLYTGEERDSPAAVVLTSVWNRKLDDQDPTRDNETADEIPGALVVSVLEKGDAPWVIVTNGKLWRLYSATADNKATNYYETDLEEALAAPEQLTALKYWWLFFRREAFTGFLDELLQQSADYAKALRERLKDRVFTEIFPHFATGFITNIRRQVGRERADFDEEVLQLVYEATLTFLYRLMFALYAESLELLPLSEERGYQQHSLYRLKGEVAGAAGTILDEAAGRLKGQYNTLSTELYERLQRLFEVIDSGDPALNLPTYNGGLFSQTSESGEFLSDYAIPDRYLALGLDRLCRDVDDKTQALVFIDYKSLGVRQLGSIYEGLLEFKLRIAGEKLAVVKEKGKEVYVPQAKAKSRVYATLEKGDVYLENDKQERKATGSYYTPDYIVKYIVEHTVGPVLERKFEELAPRLREAQKQFRRHRDIVKARGNDQPAELFWNTPEMQSLADDCLNVRVLDPAMGSGHFLVEVVDFVSNRLIDFLNGWSENPVWGLLERIREDILEEMERQRVSIDPARLTRVALLKRAVLKRCVYGVDLNGMAVELAKVSLWLDAFTLGAPLSFLNHHLKPGNSLIGAWITESRKAIEGSAEFAVQLSLFSRSRFEGLKQAIEAMRRVSFLSDNTVEQVRESQESYENALIGVDPFKRVLNVYLSRWFGNGNKKNDDNDPALQFLRRDVTAAWQENPKKNPLPQKDIDGLQLAQIGAVALQIAKEKSFFHWELEFPEVFFAPSRPGGQDVQLLENGGFNAIVGNPPYIPTEQLTISDKSFFIQRFVLERKYETSVIFTQATLRLLGPQGRTGLITPVMWQTGENYSQFREEVLTQEYQPIRIVNLPFDIFPDAYIDTGIQVLSFAETQPNIDVLNYSKHESLSQISDIDERWQAIPWQYMKEEPGNKLYMEREQYEIRRKMRKAEQFVTLGDITDSCQGIVESFYTYTEQKQNERQILYRNLEAYRYGHDVVEERFIDMEPSDSLYHYYTNPRILIRRIVSRSNRLMAIKAEIPFVVKKDLNPFILRTSVPISLDYLLAILNSSLISFLYTGGSTASLRDDFRQTTLAELKTLPIRQVKPLKSPGVSEKLREDYRNNDYSSILADVMNSLDNEQIELVHNALGFLSRQMIALNERKHKEAQRFLGWLETFMRIRSNEGRGIDTLTGKTLIQNYLGDYEKGEPTLSWDEFYYRLYQNRSRFGVNLADVQGQIQSEYEKSLTVLRPIKEQLAATDGLIDKIVYQLYGLTDEEIELIERPAYEQALAEAKEKALQDKKLQKDPEAAAEAIAGEMLPAARKLQSRVNLMAEEERLAAELPGWRLFNGDVPTFLLTGEYNIHHLPDHLDHSSSVIAYAKAVETALMQRLFEPFRSAGPAPADCHNRFLREFVQGDRHLTLGSFAYILTSKEKALQAFAERQYPGRGQQLFFDQSGGVRALLDDMESVALRNKAAHDEVLTREDARKARAWALGILRHL